MSDEPTPPAPDPRRALIESNLARAREKLLAANVRVEQLEDQVAALEEALAELDAPPAEE
jgi:BMFP domain-containing protein YqiC